VDRLRIVFFLSILLLLWTAPVCAGTVAIVRLPSPTPDLTEAMSRLYGELLSVGLQVRIIDRPVGRRLGRTDSRAWLEAMAAKDGIDAVIDIIGDTTPVAVDVWVIEKSPRRLNVSRVALEPNTTNPSERLAIRAVEVLRSTFLENDMATSEKHVERVAKPRTALPQVDLDQPAPRRERFGVELGALAMTSLDGIGPAILPIARLDWAARPWFVVKAELAGLGSRPTLATAAGNARIDRQYGILSGCYRFGPYERLWPFVCLSAGALRTSVEGHAESPRRGHDVRQWSLLLDGGLGEGLRLADRYYLTLAAHVQMAEPYVAIHFVDRVVATTGRPNLLLALTVGAWL
jgi:hypothetical protein